MSSAHGNAGCYETISPSRERSH